MCFSSDGERFFASDEERRVNLWDVDTGTLIRRTEPLSDLPTALALSPAGDRIAAYCKSCTVELLDADTLDILLPHKDTLRATPCMLLPGRVPFSR